MDVTQYFERNAEDVTQQNCKICERKVPTNGISQHVQGHQVTMSLLDGSEPIPEELNMNLIAKLIFLDRIPIEVITKPAFHEIIANLQIPHSAESLVANLHRLSSTKAALMIPELKKSKGGAAGKFNCLLIWMHHDGIGNCLNVKLYSLNKKIFDLGCINVDAGDIRTFPHDKFKQHLKKFGLRYAHNTCSHGPTIPCSLTDDIVMCTTNCQYASSTFVSCKDQIVKDLLENYFTTKLEKSQGASHLLNLVNGSDNAIKGVLEKINTYVTAVNEQYADMEKADNAFRKLLNDLADMETDISSEFSILIKRAFGENSFDNGCTAVLRYLINLQNKSRAVADFNIAATILADKFVPGGVSNDLNTYEHTKNLTPMLQDMKDYLGITKPTVAVEHKISCNRFENFQKDFAAFDPDKQFDSFNKFWFLVEYFHNNSGA